MKGFVFRLIPPRPDFAFTLSDEELATMTAHARYWAGLTAQGKAVAYGPVDDPSGNYGIGIMVVEDETEAMKLRADDPALLSPHGFHSEIAPMLGLVTPGGRFDG
ncbi:MAG: hypothetical protein JWO62_2179 [Acidimicrobiaceae bacterium]|nr:hypothetical protein [Acidimicrobiaceae bacterium]